MTTSHDGPSQTVLDETPARALKLLTGIGRNPSIFAALTTRGYSPADHKEGWDLLLSVSGYSSGGATVEPTSKAAKAIAELDAWDEPNFRIARAALSSRHPEQDKFLFDSLSAAKGAEAVVSVTTFLDRLDALESGKGRKKSSHAADQAAVETLARRKIDAAERKRLRALLKDVAEAPQLAVAAAGPLAEDPAKHDEGLRKLRAWYDEWAETARVVIKRRDHLIRLGLAQRKTSTDPGVA